MLVVSRWLNESPVFLGEAENYLLTVVHVSDDMAAVNLTEWDKVKVIRLPLNEAVGIFPGASVRFLRPMTKRIGGACLGLEVSQEIPVYRKEIWDRLRSEPQGGE
jgi:sRNA-binding carbon storage regulator CsrA